MSRSASRSSTASATTASTASTSPAPASSSATPPRTASATRIRVCPTSTRSKPTASATAIRRGCVANSATLRAREEWAPSCGLRRFIAAFVRSFSSAADATPRPRTSLIEANRSKSLPMIGLLAAIALQPSYDVTIRRDQWGIPHVEGKRDADVVFGLMFAQAEDDYETIETSAMGTIGRAAELRGEGGLTSDVRFRSYRIEELAKARLARADRHFQAIAQAYADGLNLYLAKHPETETRIKRYEPWFFLAGVNLPSNVDGIETAPEPAKLVSLEVGSNAWAIAPTKTTNGRATLFANPHVNLFGPGARYECVLKSGQGWEFDGFCILGSPIPHAGHNAHLAWSHTNTRADGADAYRLTMVGEDTYRVGDKTLKLERWTETIQVRVQYWTENRKVALERSIYGPVVRRDGAVYSVRLPIERNLDYWFQKLAMNKARNLKEFRKALAMGALTYSNTTYADDRGHIAFWYGSTVPRRDPSFDWSKPVDGSDPRTEWKGFHTTDELPHVIDPKSGFVQNCNSHPWLTTVGDDNPKPSDYPSYVVRDPDTTRAQNSRRILTSQPKFTFDELSRLAFDTYLYTTKQRLPKLLAAIDRDHPAAKALAAWDGVATVDSVPATLYIETETRLTPNPRQSGFEEDPTAIRTAFEATVQELERRWGSWQVPWGKVNRLRRGSSEPTWPVPGALSAFGGIFAFSGPRIDGVHYGQVGNSYVALVEPGKNGRFEAVCVVGQSADPASPHYVDQAPYYAAGKFRPRREGFERTYRPGE
ncbi:penicillin acylase family protein [bacterium]|nr:MAG: penicillin acylase family protein [bacterium]